jgi:hypothetical protein
VIWPPRSDAARVVLGTRIYLNVRPRLPELQAPSMTAPNLPPSPSLARSANAMALFAASPYASPFASGTSTGHGSAQGTLNSNSPDGEDAGDESTGCAAA